MTKAFEILVYQKKEILFKFLYILSAEKMEKKSVSCF